MTASTDPPPVDPRRLNTVLRQAAVEQGVDLQRLRRHLVFQRLLARLAGDPRWVLKGGFALEVRLGRSARATVDLDLALARDVEDLRTLMVEALVGRGDGFAFEVSSTRPLPGDVHDGDQRMTVRCTARGREVARVRVDVVVGAEEMTGAVSPLLVRPPVSGTGLDDVEVLAVDIAQHAAEKVHAMGRTYAGGLPSSRVKDLLDLVLMAEAGLLLDPRWKERLILVYSVRDGTAPPDVLPPTPPAWRQEYPALASTTSATTTDFDAAVHLVSTLYLAATRP